MKLLISTLLSIILLVSSFSLISAEEIPKAQVMMLGLFHFNNPGKDVVKTKSVDVLSGESQAYLKRLAENIQKFRPSKVLLEYDPKNQTVMQQRYDDYLNGEYQLGINEIYQIGFRVAKLAEHKTTYSFDQRNVHWQGGPLFEYMKADGKDLNDKFKGLIKQVETTQNEYVEKLSLKEILIKFNEKEMDDFNKYLYVVTNDAHQNDKFIGANASASWWHRNFIMYAKIQAHATPGERVLVIGGQGHTAILKDFLAIDRDRISVDIKEYL